MLYKLSINFLFQRVVFDYGYNGSGRENPLENMKIYKKDSPNTSTGITPDQVTVSAIISFQKIFLGVHNATTIF